MVKKLTYINSLIPFLDKPLEWIHLARISKELSKNHPTVRLWLIELEKKGILLKKIIGKQSFFSLNLSHPNIFDYITIAEKVNIIIKSENPLLKEIISITKNFYGKLIIFGSAVDSFETASDVDMVIIGKIDLRAIETKLNKKFHIINISNLDKISKTLKKEIIKKHLIITGTDEIVRWMLS